MTIDPKRSKADDDAAKESEDAARASAIVAGVLGAVFTIGGLAVAGPKTGLSIAIGAGVAVANLVAMRAIIGAILTPSDDDLAEAEAAAADAPTAGDPVAEAEALGAAEAEKDGTVGADAASADASKKHGRRGGAAWGVFALLKILVLFGGIGLLLMRGWVEPIPLVIGYGVLPLGITASTLVASLRPKRRR